MPAPLRDSRVVDVVRVRFLDGGNTIRLVTGEGRYVVGRRSLSCLLGDRAIPRSGRFRLTVTTAKLGKYEVHDTVFRCVTPAGEPRYSSPRWATFCYLDRAFVGRRVNISIRRLASKSKP